MTSPKCLIITDNGNRSTVDGYDTPLGSRVYIQLADSTGVTDWDLTCISTDDELIPINTDLDLDLVNYSAVLTVTSAARGGAYILKSIINGGLDVNNNINSSYTTTFAVFARSEGNNRLIAANQTTEGNSKFGWISDLNTALSVNSSNVEMLAEFDRFETTGKLIVNKLNCTQTMTIGPLIPNYTYITIYNDTTYTSVFDDRQTTYFCYGSALPGLRTFVLPEISGNVGNLLIIVNCAYGELTLVTPTGITFDVIEPCTSIVLLSANTEWIGQKQEI